MFYLQTLSPEIILVPEIRSGFAVIDFVAIFLPPPQTLSRMWMRLVEVNVHEWPTLDRARPAARGLALGLGTSLC